jgi:hypothetical protein
MDTCLMYKPLTQIVQLLHWARIDLEPDNMISCQERQRERDKMGNGHGFFLSGEGPKFRTGRDSDA